MVTETAKQTLEDRVKDLEALVARMERMIQAMKTEIYMIRSSKGG